MSVPNTKLQLANNTIAVVIIDEKIFTTKEAAAGYCETMYDMSDVDFLEFIKRIPNAPTYATMRSLMSVINNEMVTINEFDPLINNASDWFLR